MRKVTLTFLLFVCGVMIYAQNEKPSLKPAKNNFTFEVNFTPFNTDKPIDINGFQGRWFVKDNFAIRAGFNFDSKKSYSEIPFKNDDVVLIESTDEKFMLYGINTGFEYHFLKSRRISPYVGLDFGYENKSSKGKYEDVVYDYNGNTNSYIIQTTEIENMWSETIVLYHPDGFYQLINVSERGYNMFSGHLILGSDVYITKHFYMGVEFGFGFKSYNYKEVKVTIDDVPEPSIPKAKDTEFGFKVNNAIRMGFWF